jgi:thiol-disulfide isomerase/thioredoxin
VVYDSEPRAIRPGKVLRAERETTSDAGNHHEPRQTIQEHGMKMQMRVRMAALAASVMFAMAGIAASAEAQEKAPETPAKEESKASVLKAGDPAPALSVEKFLKGAPVTGFEKGRVYVLEFWATWCGPCIAQMPHLSEIQKEYKDKGVTVVGINVWEDMRGDDYSEKTLTSVEGFVKDQGDRMGYTVAYDGGKRAMANAYLKASNQRGIPACFVVNGEGKIAYIGHPMFLDEVMPNVVAGTWDIKAGGEKVASIEKEMSAIFREREDKDRLEKLIAFSSKYPKIGKTFQTMKYQLQLATGDTAGAAATGKAIVEDAIAHKDAQALNEIAWGLVNPEGDVKNPDLDLAFKAASEAVKITGEKDGMILDTLARVYFVKGDVNKAIELQEKAIALAPEQMKEQMTDALNEFKAKKK